MKVTMLCLIAFCTGFGAKAQLNYDRSDFERINKAYAQIKAIRTEVDYVYYPDYSSKTPGETLQALLSLEGPNYYYRLQDVETLRTPEMTLLIDHAERQIVLESTQRNTPEMLLGADLDKLLSICTKIKYAYPAQGIKQYEMYAPLPETERIDIYFNTATFMMQRVVLFYNYTLSEEEGGTGKKPRLEMVYRNQNTRPQFAKDFFSPNRFVQKSGDRFVAAASCKGYEVIDYLSK